MATQLLNAKRGNITDEMKFVSEAENIDVETLRENIANGQAVILKNNTRIGSITTAIGKDLRIKVASIVGTTDKKVTLDKELDKIRVIEQAGCDVLLDNSIGNLIDETRQAILSSTRLPVGANPFLQASIETIEQEKTISLLSKEKILSTIEKYCIDGVDFISLDCAATKDVFKQLKTQKRLLGITTKAGMLLADYIDTTNNENPLYLYFDEILEIIKPYDVVLSIANTTKPACIEDSFDRAQMLEAITQGEIAAKARNYGVQVMIENMGHCALDKIKSNIETVKNLTNNAPLFTCASISDSTIGYDHINSSIASTMAGLYGANMFNSIPAIENITSTTSTMARESVITSRIAAQCADFANKNSKAIKTNKELIKAEIENNQQSKLFYCIDRLALNSHEKSMEPNYVQKITNETILNQYKKDLNEEC